MTGGRKGRGKERASGLTLLLDTFAFLLYCQKMTGESDSESPLCGGMVTHFQCTEDMLTSSCLYHSPGPNAHCLIRSRVGRRIKGTPQRRRRRRRSESGARGNSCHVVPVRAEGDDRFPNLHTHHSSLAPSLLARLKGARARIPSEVAHKFKPYQM